MATFAIGITSPFSTMYTCLREPGTYKAPFSDRSAMNCRPSHQGGEVVVPGDIVVRGRREDDWNPQDKPKAGHLK
jgi:hypothetical protein